MPTSITSYKVFIASPGGLDAERRAFRNTINSYNETEALHRQVRFEPVGWEVTLGGVGRPQELINEDVRKCDFFILLLWDRWGTPPSKEGMYTSGTEEEFSVAQECLSNSSLPMQQIAVFFKAVDPRQLSDPGDQLQSVLNFKKKLEEEKSLLYHTFDDTKNFEDKLRAHLAHWIRNHEQNLNLKRTRANQPSPLVATKSATLIQPTASTSTQELTVKAQEFAAVGKLTDAETTFARAIARGDDPLAFEAYGDFLLGTHRLSQAEAMYERALELCPPTETKKRAGLLLSTADARQERGNLTGAEDALRQTLLIAKEIDDQDILATAYDQLGNVMQARSNMQSAEQMHNKALEIRRRLNNKDRLAQSYVHLGILLANIDKPSESEAMLRSAAEIGEELQDDTILSVAYLNLANTLQMQGDLKTSEELLRKSLSLQRKLGNTTETVYAYGNLALSHLSRGKLNSAEKLFKKTLSLAQMADLPPTAAKTQAFLSDLYSARGDLKKAESLIRLAITAYERLEDPLALARAYKRLGHILTKTKNHTAASELFKKSLSIFLRLGKSDDAAEMEKIINKVRPKKSSFKHPPSPKPVKIAKRSLAKTSPSRRDGKPKKQKPH